MATYYDVGMLGCGVMGANLCLNMLSHGFSVVAYDIDAGAGHRLMQKAIGQNIAIAKSIEGLVGMLAPPRLIMLMIAAGQPVDAALAQLMPLLSPGDCLIDGGNSHYADTQRCVAMCEGQGVHFIGMGVSGGEEGALKGPSLMPGGSFSGWQRAKELLSAICAKADGVPCCAWIGEAGAGHFVKMVHNGIEYADMQLIGEIYHLLRAGGLEAGVIGDIFAKWDQGALRSYLIGITADILKAKAEDGQPLVDKILDSAGQKGTGKWAIIAALEEGAPLPSVAQAVFMRCLSSKTQQRQRAQEVFAPEHDKPDVGDGTIEDMEKALYAAKLLSYAQGFGLMREASHANGWKLNLGNIALTWRGGCIIRCAFLDDVKAAFVQDADLENLALAPFFAGKLKETLPALRRVCVIAVQSGIPIPCLSSALSYFDALSVGQLGTNLLQAQRDYFGAHTYERVDKPRGVPLHTDWLSLIK